MKKPLKFVLVGALVVAGCFFLIQLRARNAQRDLAELLPRITAITLYDIHDLGRSDSNTIASAISAPFPLEEFRRIGAAAPNKGGIISIWKGSSLAVFSLSDGTQRQARFSYGLGFFTVEGISGRFVGGAEFERLHSRVIQKQFFPKRLERNKNRNA